MRQVYLPNRDCDNNLFVGIRIIKQEQMETDKAHQHNIQNGDENQRFRQNLRIDECTPRQQNLQQNSQTFSNSTKSQQYSTRQTQIDRTNVEKEIKNTTASIMQEEMDTVDYSKDKYKSNWASESEIGIYHKKHNITINSSSINKGKRVVVMDGLKKREQVEVLVSKVSRMLYGEAFQCILSSCQDRQLAQKITSNNLSYNGYKTPTRGSLWKQANTAYTSDRSYQISTAHTEYNIHNHEEQIKNLKSTHNFNIKETYNLDKDELIKELQFRLDSQDKTISQLSNKVKTLNDQINGQDASLIEMEVQKNIEIEEIKSLQEELREHQKNNDYLLEQIHQLTAQNNSQTAQLAEYERLLKIENTRFIDYQREVVISQNKWQSTKQDLLQRIEDQEVLIEQKTQKNTELQNQMLKYLQQNKQSSDNETLSTTDSMIQMQQIQIQEQNKQIDYLQRSNDILRQENRVFFQEKEMSLFIISQLEVKFDQERHTSQNTISDLQNSLKQKQYDSEKRENVFAGQREELLKKKAISSKKEQEIQYLKERQKANAYKQVVMAARMMKDIIKRKKAKQIQDAFQKMVQNNRYRTNHRSVGRYQSKSPVSKSKRDLSPLRDITFIERRRIASFGKYLFLKYKKVMQRVFFKKLKAVFVEKSLIENIKQEKKRISLSQQFIQLLKAKRTSQCLKVWKYKTNVMQLSNTLQKIKFNKLVGYSFNRIVSVSEQQKNNQKIIKFCNSVCNFVIKLQHKQLEVAFSILEAKRICFNLRTNKLQIILVKSLIKYQKNTLITYFRKWRSFNEIQGVQEQAYHESESIQEKKRILDSEINSFFDNRIDFSKIEQAFRQRQTERSAEKNQQERQFLNKNFESSRSFVAPLKSQVENIYEEVSFQQRKAERIGTIETNEQFAIKIKDSTKEKQSQKNLFLNEYDLNQDSMLFSNDIHKKNLSSRSCQSHKSSSQSYKSSAQVGNSMKRNTHNNYVCNKSPKPQNCNQQLIESISYKYLQPNDGNSNQLSEDAIYLPVNASDMSIYSETLQEQKNYYKS